MFLWEKLSALWKLMFYYCDMVGVTAVIFLVHDRGRVDIVIPCIKEQGWILTAQYWNRADPGQRPGSRTTWVPGESSESTGSRDKYNTTSAGPRWMLRVHMASIPHVGRHEKEELWGEFHPKSVRKSISNSICNRLRALVNMLRNSKWFYVAM